MLGTFPKAFPKRQLPKCILPSGNFSTMCNAISQAATSQACPSRSALPKQQPNLTFGKLPLGELHIWEVAAWEIAHLASCYLGSPTWENTFGKKPNNSTLHLTNYKLCKDILSIYLYLSYLYMHLSYILNKKLV